MAIISFTINGEERTVDVDPEMKLLWVLRDVLNLTGTKYSCGMSLCGACTVHLDGKPIRSCSTAATRAAGRSVTTIEGLAEDSSNPLIQAWVDEEVAQCGYCQSGQIMIAADLLAKKTKPTDADIDGAMSRALCRCGTYQRIRRAIHRAAGEV
jgi:aerobic-type carbon monoxide dehydrogenase small subunit (CoxS/CutS family)